MGLNPQYLGQVLTANAHAHWLKTTLDRQGFTDFPLSFNFSRALL